jgi:hypothetical protein
MPNKHVHVCFMTDINHTMKNHIGALKDQFETILDDVQNQYPTSVIEVAFVGYSAVLDIPSDYFEPFTTNRKLLQRKMKNGNVSFGFSRECRMVVEGYTMVSNLNWRFANRIMFHMGNAPAHGSRYHDDAVDDRFKYGHPYWTLEEQVEKVAAMEIDVVILKISKTTTIMEKIMQESYQKIREHGFYVVDLTKHLNNLDDAVYNAVKSHMLRVMT